MGRSEHKRERSRSRSPLVEESRRRRGRSRSQTYSLSPRREEVSTKRSKDERGDRRRSRSRSRSRDRPPRGGGYGGGGGGPYGYGGGGGGFRPRFGDGRDNPNPGPCLGVFGMSLHTSERDLKHLFGRYGEVESVQIVYDRYSGRSRGFGFVYFTSTKDASRAKEHMMDAEIDGMKVRVDYSVTRGGGPYRHSRNASKSPVRHNGRSRSR